MLGPGQAFMPFIVMEDLLDKLKLLHYEEEFVAELRYKKARQNIKISRQNLKSSRQNLTINVVVAG